MRLTLEQADIIRNSARKHFGSATRVWLFGSRTDDSAKGGDIDLLVEAADKTANSFMTSIRFEVDLQNALGDQKIDILLSEPGGNETAMHRMARTTGVEL
jgi:predicted nucleotidyltransferase